jgi:hypothetical protein
MGIVVEFFTAPDDDAARCVTRAGPEARFPTLSDYGNFLAFQAMMEWESLLTGRGFADLVEAGEPRVVAGRDGGAVIYAFSPVLQNSLAAADRAELIDVAARWVHDGESIGATLDPELAHALLQSVAEFARAADDRNHAVYCWMV